MHQNSQPMSPWMYSASSFSLIEHDLAWRPSRPRRRRHRAARQSCIATCFTILVRRGALDTRRDQRKGLEDTAGTPRQGAQTGYQDSGPGASGSGHAGVGAWDDIGRHGGAQCQASPPESRCLLD
ncbi:MAG: hypothetical protein MZV64_28285 [Ignavibacteriales bacterium]|nr:hypothetical protein [Ignavibacteriales bacterium]